MEMTSASIGAMAGILHPIGPGSAQPTEEVFIDRQQPCEKVERLSPQ